MLLTAWTHAHWWRSPLVHQLGVECWRGRSLKRQRPLLGSACAARWFSSLCFVLLQRDLKLLCNLSLLSLSLPLSLCVSLCRHFLYTHNHGILQSATSPGIHASVAWSKTGPNELFEWREAKRTTWSVLLLLLWVMEGEEKVEDGMITFQVCSHNFPDDE